MKIGVFVETTKEDQDKLTIRTDRIFRKLGLPYWYMHARPIILAALLLKAVQIGLIILGFNIVSWITGISIGNLVWNWFLITLVFVVVVGIFEGLVKLNTRLTKEDE